MNHRLVPLAWLLFALACGRKKGPEPVELGPRNTPETATTETEAAVVSVPIEQVPAAPPEGLTAERKAMHTALSSRDGAPSCSDVEALASAQPHEDYLWLIEHVQQPPWVGIRAATCILQHHHEAAWAHIQHWLTQPELKGLALLVLNEIDSLPEDRAIELAQFAIRAGADPEAVRERLAQSSRPSIAALAQTPIPPESDETVRPAASETDGPSTP